MTAWSLVSDAVPLYWLYALLFGHAGLSGAAISGLFALWSATGFLCELPAGALADRFSRRGVLVAGALIQALAYALWTAFPSLPAFAAGFVLWGVSGALISGAFEALLYDGLAVAGEADRFPALYGRVTAIGLIAQVPAALAATGLYALGGFTAAGWASVGCCLAAAVLAARLPEARLVADDEAFGQPGYLATLRSGLVEAVRHPGVRTAVAAVAVLGGLDAIDEYFPLMARDWGVPTGLNPVAVLAIPVAGAAGAALAGRTGRARTGTLTALMLGSAALLGLAAAVHRPVGLAAVAAFYALYRAVLVAVEARLQDRIDGARATVTSVAALGVQVMTFAVYATWAFGGVVGTAAAFAVAGLALPLLVRARGPGSGARHRPERRAESASG